MVIKIYFARCWINSCKAIPISFSLDYQSYVDCQDRVSETFRDQEKWSRMAILNAARMGKFSSDRAIREYSQNIWRVTGITLC